MHFLINLLLFFNKKLLLSVALTCAEMHMLANPTKNKFFGFFRSFDPPSHFGVNFEDVATPRWTNLIIKIIY